MASLALRGIHKRFGDREVLRNITVEMRSGEFFSVIGPSGCGKTTLLRVVSGFEAPESGRVEIGGTDVTSLLPQDRKIGMVFQNYALFPHMTAGQNVAYGLESRKVPRGAIRRRVEDALDAVGLGGKRDAAVPTLSGGEQQRVAVARALVIEPAVLLLDEPLSNLDVSLRQHTREEIRALQRRVGITTVYVTHDQSEAMSLSDRIAVMREGRLEQCGPPRDVYGKPLTPFVASFLGNANIFTGRLGADRRSVDVDELAICVRLPEEPPALLRPGAALVLAIRPEGVVPLPPTDPGALFTARVTEREYLGFLTLFHLRTPAGDVRSTVLSADPLASVEPGQEVGVTIDPSHCSWFAA